MEKVYSSEEIREIINEHKSILEKKFYLSNFLLFGSYAKNEQTADSDIDLLLLLDKDVITLEDRMALTAPLYDIELQTGIQINPFIESMRKWGKRFTPFYENVMKEGVVL